VFAAHHELLDVKVALKVLSTDLTRNSAVIDRFLREARAVARLKSDHVVRVMDVGTLEGRQPYIVMELLEGEDLEHRIQRVNKLPVPEAVDCILQSLEAMAHAHAAGIIHRDLKPANLFLTATPDGREVVKVLDFGIAKLSPVMKLDGARSGGLTGEHTMLGSPSYMSPEQVRDSSVIDQRADLWALGVILYEIVTGREPFPGGSVGEIFGAILHSTPTPVRELRPDAPPELQAAIERTLARQPEERFPNVAELARALAPLGSGAWNGHVARIEQTLARARPSDPAGPRASLPSVPSAPELRVRARTPMGSSPGPPSAPRVAFTRTGENAPPGKQTLSEPPSGQEETPRKLKSHGRLAVMGLAFGAALAGLAVLAVPRTPRNSKVVAEPLSSATATTPAAPAKSTSEVPAPPSVASASASTPEPSAEHTAGRDAEHSAGRDALPADSAHRPAKPQPPRKPAPPSAKPTHPTTNPAGLPGVLESPD
jgi:serine/threonine-protein kinase